MRHPATAVLLALALAAAGLAGGCGGGEESTTRQPDGFDAGRALADLRAQVRLGPRPSGSAAAEQTASLIARRLRAAGAEEVGVQRPLRNVVGTLPGEGPGAVVIGAHYDTKPGIAGFLGANDGASGVAVVLELARSLPRPLPGPSVHLALFDGEEARGDRPFEQDGMRGARQYVELAGAGGGQGAPPLAEIEAMVLFDMVGDCELALPREALSDPGLHGLFAAAAERRTGSPAPFEGERGAVLDDHVPFREAGVPALDLIDLAYGPGPEPGAWWHSREDTLERICAASLDAVGEAALAAIPRIGAG